MAIQDDFTIDYSERRIRHNTGPTTVYGVNALYSWLMDDFDAQAQMSVNIPMSAQTPTDYTLINQWFIDEVSIKFLKTGAIKTDGWLNQIRLLKMKSAGYTGCIDSDIGKPVVGGTSTHTGTLLFYDNTTRYWWVRSTQAFQNDETCTITGGTGVGDISSRATGEELYSNIYTLGTIEAGTDAYVYQAGAKLTSWWPAGHIDILVRVKEMGTFVDSGILWVFMRVWTKKYDHSSVDVSAGGRTPVPFATEGDLNNPTAIGTVANYDDVQIAFVNGTITYGTGSGTAPAVGNVAIDVVSGATGIILAVGTAVTGTLTLGNVDGVFGNTNGVEEMDSLAFDGQTGAFAVGDVVTTVGGWQATIGRLVQTFGNNGTEGRMYVHAVTGTVNDNDELQVSSVTKAIAKGTLQITTWAATLTSALTSASSMNKDLNNGNGPQPYNVIIRCQTRAIDSIYEFLKYVCVRTSDWQTYRVEASVIVKYNGERYDMALLAYSPVKGSPFGTFAGGKFFGARGIWVENMATADAQNFQLTDANGVTQTPPNYQEVKVTGLVVGDQVAVFFFQDSGPTTINVVAASRTFTRLAGSFLTDGFAPGDVITTSGFSQSGNNTSKVIETVSALVITVTDATGLVNESGSGDERIQGNVNKNMCGGCAATGAGVDYLNVTGPIPEDLPSTGIVRVTETTTGIETIYSYSGIDYSGLKFTGLSPVTAYAYDVNDTLYVPYIDKIAAATIEAVVIKIVANRYVLVRVRKKGILPFEVENAISSTGMSQAAIRTTDAIVT